MCKILMFFFALERWNPLVTAFPLVLYCSTCVGSFFDPVLKWILFSSQSSNNIVQSMWKKRYRWPTNSKLRIHWTWGARNRFSQVSCSQVGPTQERGCSQVVPAKKCVTCETFLNHIACCLTVYCVMIRPRFAAIRRHSPPFAAPHHTSRSGFWNSRTRLLQWCGGWILRVWGKYSSFYFFDTIIWL